jgi:hypothetical protein
MRPRSQLARLGAPHRPRPRRRRRENRPQRGTAKISPKGAVGGLTAGRGPRPSSPPRGPVTEGAGCSLQPLTRPFGPKASGSLKSERGFASEDESSLKPWTAPGKVRVPIRPAPPLTSGNASYCGFRPYLGCTPCSSASEQSRSSRSSCLSSWSCAGAEPAHRRSRDLDPRGVAAGLLLPPAGARPAERLRRW